MSPQTSISGKTKKDEEIWFTYHSNALEATREAIKWDETLKVRPRKSDNDLDCVKNSRPKDFSKSLNAIVLNIFVIEYRINRAAEWDKDIRKTKLKKIIDEKEEEIYNTRGKNGKPAPFGKLSLYLRWRNILRAKGKPETEEYILAVKNLKKWIKYRHKIAHADYKKIQSMDISPKSALKCYDEITKAIFDLNVALGYGDRKDANKECKKMLLKQ